MERGQELTRGRAAATIGAATSAVGAVTAANRLGAFRLTALAATPRAVGEGKVWLLLSSALLADRPAVASLLGFGFVGIVALVALDWRVAAAIGAAGHVFSALVLYGLLGLARLVDPNAFAAALAQPDYGLSAIVAAWLGALSARWWCRSRLGVAALCLASAGIGWLLRGSLTVLDAEHVVAFALGVAAVQLAEPGRRPRAGRASGRLLEGRNRAPARALPQTVRAALRVDPPEL